MSGGIQLNNNSFIYVHDPMCSWCWGYKHTLQQLRLALPQGVSFVPVLGGLAPDTDQPMPEEMKQHIQSNWKNIQRTIPGIKFNYDFWTRCRPRRSTYPACRAVLVAERYNKGEQMNEAIQHAYYLEALNPSDYDVLYTLAQQIGLDKQCFIKEIHSGEINQQLMQSVEFCRSIGADSFPSLFFYQSQQFYPLVLDYTHYEVTLDHINSIIQS